MYDANWNWTTFKYVADYNADGTLDAMGTTTVTYDELGNITTYKEEADSNADGTVDRIQTDAITNMAINRWMPLFD